MFTRKSAFLLAVLIFILSNPGAVIAQSVSLEMEIARLPEMKSSPNLKIAETILALSKQYPEAFQKMLTVGLPEHRKYCSPLQALYWLYEDGYSKVAEKITGNYDLNKLLGAAWYSDKYVSSHPELLGKQKHRWGNFNTVVERLNSPELIDFYEKKFFKYAFYYSKTATPDLIFIKREGNCDAYAAFTLLCLDKAGYKAWKLNPPHHWTVAYQLGDKFYALDNARRVNRKKIGLAGPYDSMSDLNLQCRYY
jgi:hypothetical protein